MSEYILWPITHYTVSRSAWWRRSIVWRHLALRRDPDDPDLFEWEAAPSMRFWSNASAVQVATVLNRARASDVDIA